MEGITMHERIGDALTDGGGGPCGNGVAQSVWARLFGEQVDNRYVTYTDARANGQEIGVQSDVDLWRGSFLPGHRDTAGVYFAYGSSNVDVGGLITNANATAYVLRHTGWMDLNAYSGGVYWNSSSGASFRFCRARITWPDDLASCLTITQV
jgi:hypothetical protein